jgi:hypothetical protein
MFCNIYSFYCIRKYLQIKYEFALGVEISLNPKVKGQLPKYYNIKMYRGSEFKGSPILDLGSR